MVGLSEDGSSRLPTRTTRNCGRAEDLANKCDPQFGQNWRVTSLPLFAFLVCSANSPVTIRPSAGTSIFTVPLAARCWQSRHQQTLVARGSETSLKLTAPHRHRPVLSFTAVTSLRVSGASAAGSGYAARWRRPSGAVRPRKTHRVVYPPLANIVCPVIHQPSVARNLMIGTISSILVRLPFMACDLWKATRSGVSWP